MLKKLPVTLKYRCLLYGDGEQKDQIRGRIDELQLADKVFIKGFVNYNDITKVYRGANICPAIALRKRRQRACRSSGT